MINLKKILFLLFFTSVFADNYTGYIRTIDVGFCTEECGQFYIESEEGVFFTNIILLDVIDLYLNRYVQIEGDYVSCVECDALEVQSISILNDCNSPVQCFVDPCEVSECWNPNAECISNYCGGCYADFYDLNGDLLDCSDVFIAECFDVGNVFFGLCDMYLGVAVVDGACQGVSGCGWEVGGIDYSNAFHQGDECEDTCFDDLYSCEDIQFDYEQLHSGEYSECLYDNDCLSVWGHCDVGLGGCHYAVNNVEYPFYQINALVNDWEAYNCGGGVCDCMGLPTAICNEGDCGLAYCYDENPVGCFSAGCPDGYECVDVPNNCTPSSCFCDESSWYGNWYCTEDCGGGTCVVILSGDVNYDGQLNISDIVIIVNMILGSMDIVLDGDMNGDNALDIIDVVMIINIILNTN